MKKNTTQSPFILFLLTLTSFVLVSTVVLWLCKCGIWPVANEGYVNIDVPLLCVPEDPCDWARAHVLGLLDPTNHLNKLRAFLPKKDVIIAMQYMDLQREAIQAATGVLFTSPKFITFYTDLNFLGRVFVIPAQEVTWDAAVVTKPFASAPVPTTHINEFVNAFQFFYGRRFSCVIPPGYKVVLTPVEGGSYPYEPVVLNAGQNHQVIYHKGPLAKMQVIRVI